MMLAVVLFASGSGTQPQVTAAKPFDRAVAAVEARIAQIDRVENTIPGSAIVAVQAGRSAVIDVRGVTRADNGSRVTADTPFYIASMTKAFVGLMAVRLDEQQVMPLSLTLGELFPEMQVKGVDLTKVTMRNLLSHQVGFVAPALNMRTAYTDLIPTDAYPAIVAATQAPADAKFQYSNLGYLLYAAALERRTGRSWKSWLDDVVLDPLGMQHSSARSSDLSTVAWGHERVGDQWRMLPPKRDSVMHAAGGIVVSARDMARFLSAQAGAPSAIPKRTIAAAHSGTAVVDLKDGPMRCTGYSFGWIKCSAFGESFITHTGEYTGQRSVMVVVPARHAGFAAMFNSDSMTGGLGQQLAMAFVAELAGKGSAVPAPAELATMYRGMAERYRTSRTRHEQETRDKPEWGGWSWKPALPELNAYAGRYRNAGYGELDVSVGGRGLQAQLNGTAVSLEPAIRDRFGAAMTSYSNLFPIVFERNASGAVTAATFDDFRMERIAP